MSLGEKDASRDERKHEAFTKLLQKKAKLKGDKAASPCA